MSSKDKKFDDDRRKALKEKIDKNIETLIQIQRQSNDNRRILHHLIYAYSIIRGVDEGPKLKRMDEQLIEKQAQKINVLKDQYLRLSSANGDKLTLLENEINLDEMLLNRNVQYQASFLEGLRNNMFPQKQLNNQNEEKSEMSSKGDEFDDSRRKALKQKFDRNMQTTAKHHRQYNHIRRINQGLVYESLLLRGCDVGPQLNQLDKQCIENLQEINEIKDRFYLRLSSENEDELRKLEHSENLEELLLNGDSEEYPRYLEGLRNDMRNLEIYNQPQRLLLIKQQKQTKSAILQHALEMSSESDKFDEARRKMFQQKADNNIEKMIKLCRERYQLERSIQSLHNEYQLLRGDEMSNLIEMCSLNNKEIEDIQELNKRKESIYLRLSSEDEDEVKMVEEELNADELLLNTRLQLEPKYLQRLTNNKREIQKKLFHQQQLNKQKEEISRVKLKLKNCWKSFIEWLLPME